MILRTFYFIWKRKNLLKKGIYKILNTINNKFYIGSTNYLPSRKAQHFYHLRNNTHGNKHLQRSYNKYGIQNFQFIILEECDICNIEEREQYWIDLLKPKYNFRKIAKSNLGFNHSKKTKEKIKQTSLNHWQNEEYREKNIKGRYKAIVCYDINGDFLFEFESAKKESEVLKVKPNTVTKICKDKGFSTHGYIFKYKEENYPLKLDVEKLLKERKEKFVPYFSSKDNKLKCEVFYKNESIGIFESLTEISKYLKISYYIIFQIKENYVFKRKNSIQYNEYKIKPITLKN